jgi:hypothetical protein
VVTAATLTAGALVVAAVSAANAAGVALACWGREPPDRVFEDLLCSGESTLAETFFEASAGVST